MNIAKVRKLHTLSYTEKICSVKSVELVQEFWTGSKMLEILNDF